MNLRYTTTDFNKTITDQAADSRSDYNEVDVLVSKENYNVLKSKDDILYAKANKYKNQLANVIQARR